jgi:hypothetical protein
MTLRTVIFLIAIPFAIANCSETKFKSSAAMSDVRQSISPSMNDEYEGNHISQGDDTSGRIPQGSEQPGSIGQTLQKCLDQGNFSSQMNAGGRVIIYQSNSSNYASVVQVGANNFAQVNQTGSNNVACVIQIGDNSNAVVNQSNGGQPSSNSSNQAFVGQNSGSMSGLSAPFSAAPSDSVCLCNLLSYCQKNPNAQLCKSL